MNMGIVAVILLAAIFVGLVASFLTDKFLIAMGTLATSFTLLFVGLAVEKIMTLF